MLLFLAIIADVNATSIINPSRDAPGNPSAAPKSARHGIGFAGSQLARHIRRVVERNNGLFNTPSRLRLDKAGVVQGIGYRPWRCLHGEQHQSTLRVFILNSHLLPDLRKFARTEG